MGRNEPTLLQSKSYNFAIRVVKCTQYIQNEKKEYVLSKQFVRSGTAVGALIREAEFAESRADFCHKMSIALKEANETGYWISLLKDVEMLDEKMYMSILADCDELISMLVSTVKKLRE